MGLRTKFNLAVLVAFLIGFAGSGYLLQRLFIENARQQVLQNARIMMTSADAIRHFTDTYIAPLAEPLDGVPPLCLRPSAPGTSRCSLISAGPNSW